MSNRRNQFGALIINDDTYDFEMVIASGAAETNHLRIRVGVGMHGSTIYLSPADEAALLAYLQGRAGDRS